MLSGGWKAGQLGHSRSDNDPLSHRVIISKITREETKRFLKKLRVTEKAEEDGAGDRDDPLSDSLLPSHREENFTWRRFVYHMRSNWQGARMLWPPVCPLC